MLYFAYGSNLSSARLLQRVSSAELTATGQLREHRLLFHKVGRDGSAKCDAFFTGVMEDFLYGAVYRIDPAQKQYLDRAEGLGLGYEIKQVTVTTETGRDLRAFTYCATRIDPDIRPFHWYKEHVLCGAREHCFPESYIERIACTESLEDPDLCRKEAELGIYLDSNWKR